MGCGNSKVDSTAQRDKQEGNTNGTAGKSGAQDARNARNARNTRGQGTQRDKEDENDAVAPVAPSAPVITKIRENIKEDEGGTTQKKRTRQQINEKGFKRRIRENLRNATAGNDIEVLEKNMETFQNNHLEDGGDYGDAEERLDFLKVRKDIRDACMRRHPKVLEDSIRRVEASPYKRQLTPFLNRAYYLKQHSEDPTQFKHNIQGMDQATVSEIRHYHHPPEGVHECMIAVYMICGEKEEHLTDWSEITALMGRYGNHSLLRECQQAEGKPVDKDVALRARNYLGACSLETIRAKSNGAAAFHVWASRMVGKHENNKNAAGGTKPLTNSGGKGQQPGQKATPQTPKTPSTPSKVQNTKQIKEQQNKAKQQQQTKNQANSVANKNTAVKNNKQVINNTQNAKNAKQNTTQQMNSVGTKSTKKG